MRWMKDLVDTTALLAYAGLVMGVLLNTLIAYYLIYTAMIQS